MRVLRLQTGEEFVSALQNFAEKSKIRGAWFWAIGAADRIEIAYYDLKKKRYISRKFSGRMEIVNITGNISVREKEIAIHAHGIFSTPRYGTIGGHVISCRISATCEMYIQKTRPLYRRRDSATGLNLLYWIRNNQ